MPINKKYYIKIEVLTPLSIGAGDEQDYVKGAEFIEADGKIYFLNMRKMVAAGIDLDNLAMCMVNSDTEGIKRLLGNRLEAVSDNIVQSPAQTSNPIKAIIKNQLTGNPLVPGSSVKGAIRSHIFKSLGGNKERNGDNLFGSLKNGENFMRFIKISDFEFKEVELVNTKIFNLFVVDEEWHGGWKHGNNSNSRFNPVGFNTIYESLLPPQSACGTLMFSPDCFDVSYRDKMDRTKRGLLDINNLFREINAQTKEYLQHERLFFETYNQAEGTDDIIDSIDDLLIMIEGIDDKSCILKMSAGSGFNSITGDWQFDDYTGDIDEMGRKPRGEKTDQERERAATAKPKSRKIAIHNDGKFLMGFVKLTVVDEAESEAAYTQWHEKIEQITRNTKQYLSEKAEEQKAKEQALANKNRYNDLVEQANSKIDSSELEAAHSLIAEAKALCGESNALLEVEKRLQRVEDELLDNKLAGLRMQADEAYKNKDYQSALSLYEQIEGISPNSCYLEIGNCRKNINMSSESIKDFADSLNISSINAFANRCKKRLNNGQLFVAEDIQILANAIAPKVESMNSKGKKEWLTESSWQKILYPIMGEDLAKQLYMSITDSLK